MATASETSSLFNADLGLLSTGTFSGQEVVAVLNLATNGIAVNFFAQASTDSSTMLLPVTAASIGITTTNPRFTYHMFGFDFFGDGSDEVPGKASFNAFASAISNGQFAERGAQCHGERPGRDQPSGSRDHAAPGLHDRDPGQQERRARGQADQNEVLITRFV